MKRLFNSFDGTWFANRRFWYTLFLVTLMLLFLFMAVNETRVRGQAIEPRPDLGDAPDSDFNHSGTNNTAYFTPAFSAPILGHFPTVWQSNQPGHPSGPRHLDAFVVWLGEEVSAEEEADIGADTDGINNILSSGTTSVMDIADRDGFDDGWLNRDVLLKDCRESTLKVRVSKAPAANIDGPLFLNVWFDGNRDGDWADVRNCDDQRVAFEWIVRNFVIDSGAIPDGGFIDVLVPTVLVLNDMPDKPSWLRFTFSDQQAPTVPGSDLADGRGPDFDAQYELGETEDYFSEGFEGEPGEIGINKTATASVVTVGQVYTYSVNLTSSGGAAPVTTIMTDVLHPALDMIGGPWVTELNPSANPLNAYFLNGVGPSGAIGWQGSLSPGGAIRIDYRVKVRYCDNLQVIRNEAVALKTDGEPTTAVTEVTVRCEPPPNSDITLTKRILTPDGALKKEWSILPGREVAYRLVLNSTGDVTHTVHVSDDLPSGLIAVHVAASSGTPAIVNSGHTVVWDGRLGPANRPVHINIRAKLRDTVECGDLFANQAQWSTPYASGESNEVGLLLACHDLGDAPDSTNHFGISMTAYSGVQAQFPTVFEITATMRGPKHLRPRPLHLGRLVSVETEADVGPDVDGRNNIIPPKDRADLDKADDGLMLDKMNFAHCHTHRFPVWVRVDPRALSLLHNTDGIAYINVWLDGNRNGDWADLHQCDQTGAPEHIVIDHVVNVASLGPGMHRIWVTTSGPVFWPAAEGPAWLRITLSEQMSNKTLGGGAYGDGRGYDTAFALGETEDYILRPAQDRKPELVVEKDGYVHHWFEHGQAGLHGAWAVGWVVNYGNKGAAAANNVQVVDTYDVGGASLLREPLIRSHPFISPTVSGNQLTFDVGTLAAGQRGHIFIRALLPLTTTPGTVLTNTVTITGSGDVDLTNNQATVTVTIPFLPPRIVSPRPGTTCTGTFTITGRVQVVPSPTLMFVDVYVDGALHETVHPDNTGRWHSLVTGLSDGTHEIYAVARYQGQTSPSSPVVKVIVDSTLFWSPITLRLIDQDGFVLLPADRHGRIDETGWRVFLRPSRTYTVTVRICCSNPSAVTWQVGSQTIDLTDADGDGWYEGAFTTPSTIPANISIRICVTCSLVQRCSDGQILIDPEGTVYDLSDGQEVQGALVICMEEQTDPVTFDTQFSQWPAEDYDQENPQTTDTDGYYSFFTPAGTYRVTVSKNGYQGYTSPDLVVVEEPVEHDVYLTPDITQQANHTILISSQGFDPPILTVNSGDVVEWLNVDTEFHASTSVTPALQSGVLHIASLSAADAWDSGLLDNGESYKRRLTIAGMYTYQDGENGLYTGQVIVQHMIYLPIVIK